MSRDSIHTPAFSDPQLRESMAQALAGLGTGSGTLDAVAPQHWPLAVSMGWLSAFLPEAKGGLGLGLDVMADLGEQAGRHLFCGPLLETALLLPVLADAQPSLEPLLDLIASGALRLAITETPAGHPEGLLAEHAAGASHLLHLEGGRVQLYALSPDMMSPRQPMDPGCTLARVRPGAAIAGGALDADQYAALARAHHIALAADLLGCGEAALARSLDHVTERRQFGQPIGRFQSVKHRLADLRARLDTARLALARAVADGQDVASARLAHVLAGEAARAATGTAVQLHGGLGFSWEMDLHLWLKRALRLNARAGGTLWLKRQAGEAIIAEALAASAA